MSGFCNLNRLELSARAYAEEFGADALTTFLRNLAGADCVENVPEADRFRVNRALRDAVNGADASPLARVGRKAFARMWRQRK
jgi:hypothetical protein